jgi:hypothetical protein
VLGVGAWFSSSSGRSHSYSSAALEGGREVTAGGEVATAARAWIVRTGGMAQGGGRLKGSLKPVKGEAPEPESCFLAQEKVRCSWQALRGPPATAAWEAMGELVIRNQEVSKETGFSEPKGLA